jgi:hypothetical protein
VLSHKGENVKRAGIIAAFVAISAFGVTAAPANAAELKAREAKRAVERELRRDYEIKYPTISCSRLTSRRMRCRWEGLSRLDVARGNPSGWAGIARVTEFRGGGKDVRISVTRYGE